MTTPNDELVTIFVAEDDDGHAELIRIHLEDVGLRNPMRRFRDGQEILDFLAGQDLDHLPPWLLLLDIHMPKLSGIEVLAWIKRNPKWKTLPVIMLTTTDDPREVAKCYELGCNCYLTKPVEFLGLSETLRRLGMFLQVVRPPSGTMGEAP